MKNKSFRVFASIFLSIFISCAFFYKYQSEFYVKKAHYCFKKNNTSCVQTSLEKAFKLGFENIDERDMYLNTIITSPLDLISQKKLLDFINLQVDDSVNLRAQYFIHDLRKEINNKYEENYIMQSVLNKKVIRWGNPQVTYCIKLIDNLPQYYKNEVENALTDWSKALDFAITFVEDCSSPNIIINFIEHNPAEDEDKKYIVAYTSPIISNEELLKNMEIKFYVKSPSGNFYSQNQVYNTALHEIAHAMGVMGHSNNKKNIMYLTKDNVGEFEDSRDELTLADINTMKLLYKIKPEITNSETISGDYLPYLVLGEEEDIVDAKIKEAKLYISRAPHLPNGYIDLAEAYASIKEYPKAIKLLEKALFVVEEKTIEEMIHFNLAVCHFYSKTYILAEDSIKRALEIKNNNNSRFLLSEIYIKTDKLDEAEKELIELVNNDENSIEYAVSLINLYIKQKKYIKARKILKNYIQNNPEDRFNPKFDSYGALKIGLK